MKSHHADAGIDLTQFHAPFFEEAREQLDLMEQRLLGLDAARPDDEALHAIFRCAHSVKGGAASFGFADMASLTHRMETLLDRLRRHELTPGAGCADLLLRATDLLRAQLAALQGAAAAPPVHALLAELQAAAAGQDAPAPAAPAGCALLLTVGPLANDGALGGLLELFADIPDLGQIEALPADGRPGMHRFAVHSQTSPAELLDLFSFHVDATQLRLDPLPADAADAAGAPEAVAQAPAREPAGAPPASASASAESSLRVAVDKVDRLVNLVGELVISQSMLAQACGGLEPDAQRRLAAGLAELERHTRDLQESVMSIRMIPMTNVFSRFPRLLRDLGAQLGKRFELLTLGGATELDKGLIEKITEPLTHLVRNSCDHGIETPAERRAAGKPEAGTVTLAASHQGGSVLIEVRDDGRGLSREAILRKARERGLPADGALADEQVWALIFEPGFSTADRVTEVSGRGVGMDVVRRTIAALGGRVEIESAAGRGTTVRVRLPLTLAIMEAMTLRVGDECYVLPLASVVESLHGDAARLRTIGGRAEVLALRDEVLPVLCLATQFGVTGADAGSILVVVESEGRRVALRVHELLGQQQVVVKNLETHYMRVDRLSGATILGDGRVALILDIDALVRGAGPAAADVAQAALEPAA